jgi:hypothetical protein
MPRVRKLSATEVAFVRMLLNEKPRTRTHKQIANLFGISRCLVTQIGSGYRYADEQEIFGKSEVDAFTYKCKSEVKKEWDDF